jgi:hypothetical protein
MTKAAPIRESQKDPQIQGLDFSVVEEARLR